MFQKCQKQKAKDRMQQCITIETMSSYLRRLLRDPLVLLCMAAGLLAFYKNTNEIKFVLFV